MRKCEDILSGFVFAPAPMPLVQLENQFAAWSFRIGEAGNGTRLYGRVILELVLNLRGKYVESPNVQHVLAAIHSSSRPPPLRCA